MRVLLALALLLAACGPDRRGGGGGDDGWDGGGPVDAGPGDAGARDGGPSLDGGWAWRCSDPAAISTCRDAYGHFTSCCELAPSPPMGVYEGKWWCERFAAAGQEPVAACGAQLAATCDAIHAAAATKGECCCPGAGTCVWADGLRCAARGCPEVGKPNGCTGSQTCLANPGAPPDAGTPPGYCGP